MVLLGRQPPRLQRRISGTLQAILRARQEMEAEFVRAVI